MLSRRREDSLTRYVLVILPLTSQGVIQTWVKPTQLPPTANLNVDRNRMVILIRVQTKELSSPHAAIITSPHAATMTSRRMATNVTRATAIITQ